LIIENYFEGNKLLLNRGDGTFEEKLNVMPGFRGITRGIALADVNSDGKL
jgi:hypothetical protein